MFVYIYLLDGHRDGRSARFLEKWLKPYVFSLQVLEAIWTTWICRISLKTIQEKYRNGVYVRVCIHTTVCHQMSISFQQVCSGAEVEWQRHKCATTPNYQLK